MLFRIVLLVPLFALPMLPQLAGKIAPNNLPVSIRSNPPAIGTVTNGRFHHFRTGIEFTVPEDWTVTCQCPSSGGGEAVGFVNSAWHMEGLVWLKAHVLATKDIPDKLQSAIDRKANQRANVPGFHMLRSTTELKTVGGQHALSIFSEFGGQGLKMIEYHTWVNSENAHAYISARAPAQDFRKVKDAIDGMLTTFSVP